MTDQSSGAGTIISFSDRYRSRVLSLWNDVLPLDALTHDVFESRILLDENFDAETFPLLVKDDRLVGFALGMHPRRMPLGDADPDGDRCWITAFGIDPGFSLAEAGRVLLTELENRFRTLGKKECRISTYPPGYVTPGIDQKAYKPLLDFFLGNGYTKAHEAISMDAAIVRFEVSPKIRGQEKALRDGGIEIRPFQREDLLKFLDFLERSMPTDWVRVQRKNLRALSTGQFKTDQITVVAKGDEIIGYCQFEGSHFGPFGVAEAYQGKGIGTVLLARTLERMRNMGEHVAWVMWTDDQAAKVYQKFGFTETRRFSILTKNLAGTGNG
ncbi:MAG: GNAT family N-acetyltransferase [Ignavibacteriales bacterium]|nr:GNAT family N-acetyltransferase [Ignavibacteriales bacterium]